MSVFGGSGTDTGRGGILEVRDVRRGEESASLLHLVVVAFGSAEEAQSALADVNAMAEAKQVVLDDACVVVHKPDGSVEITETIQKGGAFHFLARKPDVGLKSDFKQQLGRVLKPGCAALAVLAYATDQGAVLETVSRWQGQVVTSDLDESVEVDLRHALAASEPPAS